MSTRVSYLAIGDRFMPWVKVWRMEGEHALESAFMRENMRDNRISHRVSSPHKHGHNQFAEGTVKIIKRLLRDNHDARGIIDEDLFQRAYEEHRNTPGNSGKAPHELILGRRTKTKIPTNPELLVQRPKNILTQQQMIQEKKKHTDVMRKVKEVNTQKAPYQREIN